MAAKQRGEADQLKMGSSRKRSGKGPKVAAVEVAIRPEPSSETSVAGKRTCILVLGMHRSGTSALTRVLSLMGAALPRRLMGGGEGNDAGHWEGARLVQYSDQLLSEFASEWTDWRPLDFTLMTVPRRAQMKADIRQIIDEDYGDQPLIVIKDPRICRFAGFFIECLQESGYRVVPVLLNRNPLEVMESLQKREIYWPAHLRRSDAALLWLSHQLEIERATRGLQRVVAGYDELLSDWKAAVQKVERQGDISFARRPAEVERDVVEFLNPGRRTHHKPASAVHLEPDLHGWVSDTFEALRQMEVGLDGADQRRVLDQIRREFLHTSPLLYALTAERRQMQGEAGAIRNEAEAKRDQAMASLASIQEELRVRQQEIAELLAGNEALKDSEAALESNLRQLQDRLAQGAAELEDAKRELAEARAQLAEALAQVAEARAQVAEARAQLAEALAQLAKAQSQKDAALTLSEARSQQLEALAGQLSAVQLDVQQAKQRLEEAIMQQQSLQHEYGLAQAELVTKTDKVDQLTKAADEARGAAARLQSGAQQIVGLYNEQQAATYRTHLAYRSSTSWRVSAPLRWVSSLVRGRAAKPVPPVPLRFEDHFGTAVTPYAGALQGSAGVAVSGNDIVFFTICSRNFMAFARTLFQSLARFYPKARMVVAVCDDKDDYPPFVAANEPYEFVYLDDLNIPDWRGMSQRYNVTEFNTAIKPFVFLHLFEKGNADYVVYFDPDIYVVNNLAEIEEAFGNGAEVILTPHMLEPNERAEMNERRLLQYGIYNLGFVGIARTAKSLDVVRWWGRKLERECIIKREEGLFVDQKWADHFPAFFTRPYILHHPGYNIAYWNLSNRTVSWAGDCWMVNGLPVRFLHFSGNNLDDPKVLSRHSGEHRADTIGEMKVLLDEYRAAVFGNGHADFRKIPYAFSWSGASGFNEHTPKPAHELNGSSDAQVAARSGRAASGTDIIRTAMDIVGGPGKLISKTARVISRGDLASLKRGINLARTAAQERRKVADRAQAVAAQPEEALIDWQPFRKSILVIEWKTPRPDADSGSRTVFYTSEILTLLGYRVTFLPLSLAEDGAYSRALTDLGVRCIDASLYSSVREFLEAEGESFDFVMLNRVSVVASQMDQIKASCPRAKLIFNTVDLHYLRELRDAEMNGLSTASALHTKALELGIVRDSDLTIVLSHAEEEMLRLEVPEAKTVVMPLIFSELDTDPPGFDARSDILFIGSFPHQPNVDAILYFADQIFPALRAQNPDLRLHVVGSEPTAEVLQLGKRPGIIVHGFVADIAPLFRSVRLSVAPLRFGAGIKGKIATSLSFGVPCVCTPIAAEGMRIDDGDHVIIADTVEEWCRAVTSVYSDRDRWTLISAQARQVAVQEFSLSANTLRIAQMMATLDHDADDMAFLRFTSQEEFDTYSLQHPETRLWQDEVEKALLPHEEGAFDIVGFCAVCGEKSQFTTSYAGSADRFPTGERSPNWRQQLACNGCGFTMQQRAMMQLFLSRVYQGVGTAVHFSEQATPLFRWLQSIHPRLEGSANLGDASSPGLTKDRLRNENLTALTCADASFDVMLALDVPEHMSGDLAAFRESCRCLRPGGTLMFTAPFEHRSAKASVDQVLLASDNAASGLNGEGWDIVGSLAGVGFDRVEIMNYWSRDFAYLGENGFIFIARKGYLNG